MTMNKETIKKAADEFANREYETSVVDRDYLHKGFYHGALWRINAAWHCVNEIPKGGKNYMIVYSFGNSYDIIDIRCDYDRFCKEDWADYVSSKGIKRWAYISDLMPDGKED